MYARSVIVAWAVIKRSIANAGDAVWNGDGGKGGANLKRPTIDAGDAVWNGDGGKRWATGKRTNTDVGDVLPQGYRGPTLTRYTRHNSGWVDHAWDFKTISNAGSITTWKRIITHVGDVV
jgi:hypothetical protein